MLRGLAALTKSPQIKSGAEARVCAVLGSQWGDEGKGKLVDILAQRYDICARFNGGANAGHTLVVNGKKYAFHLLPCGMLYPNVKNIIGNGVVVHVPTMFEELEQLHKDNIDTTGRLLISNRAHLLFDVHMIVDGMQEKALPSGGLGTTKRGIGPCYSTKATRSGIRVGDLLHPEKLERLLPRLIENYKRQFDISFDTKAELEKYKFYAEKLKPMIIDSVHYVNHAINTGKTVLAEGANAAMLDLDFGTYPFVTSSPTTIGGICTGLGIAPSKIDCAVGVVKAYTTRVGEGPFPTELNDEIGQSLRKIGGEFGATTGRPRRCGWLDIPVVRYAHLINNFDSINITKLDVLSHLPEIQIGVAYTINGQVLPEGYMPSTIEELSQVKVQYETVKGWQCDISQVKKFDDLPAAAKSYIKRIEELTKCPVSWIGTGPARTEMLSRDSADV